MRKSQRGISLGGLLVVSILLIVVAMLGIKLVPTYLEFMAIKKAVNAVATEKSDGATIAQIRNAFDLRRSVDDFTAVTGADLEINKDASGLQVSAHYRKEIKLVGNVGLFIDFAAVSRE